MRKDIRRRLDNLENKTGGTEIKFFSFAHLMDDNHEGEYANREAAKEAAAEWQDEAPHIERIAIMFGLQDSSPLQSEL